MERIIKTAKKEEFTKSEIFVERVFTESEDAESGALVRNLVREISSKRYYEPELDIIMLAGEGKVIGLADIHGYLDYTFYESLR